MKQFKVLRESLNQIAEAVISASGGNADSHHEKYVKPYLPGNEKHAEGTHTLAATAGHIEKGSQVTIHNHRTIDNKSHVTISKPNDSKNKVTVPVSRLEKPGTKVENEGHKFETNLFNHLQSHNIVPKEAKPAGSTGGTDFPIQNKAKNTTHKGRASSEQNVFHGEAKMDTTAAFGQLTVHHTPEKGWHVPDKARALRPKYAKEVEKSGVLEHLNTHSDPTKHKIETTASGRAKSIVFKHPDLKPANAYLEDHHVHVLHVGGGYGTYHIGKKDVTGHGFPALKGEGKWTAREKQKGNKTARTIMFQPNGTKGLEKSHINLENDDHAKAFKKTLGVD
jgi:hypothetical protein